jgi:hypothetical protein
MKLKSGLATVEATKEQGKFTAAQLEQDREKMKRIDSGLDNVQSEMELSQVLITRFVKRVASDKVIIAFATLLVLSYSWHCHLCSTEPESKHFQCTKCCGAADCHIDCYTFRFT